MLTSFFFYFFAFFTILFAGLVVIFQNTMHGVFSLILTFISCAGLFLMAGAEFLAMILIVVYVGAVAVLFLFVVMMLGVDFNRLRPTNIFYRLLASTVVLAFMGVLYLLLRDSGELVDEGLLSGFQSNQNNIHILGELLYTHHFIAFQLAGFILFVAMIGAILLTLRHREDAKRQNIHAQTQRTGKNSIQMVSVPLRKGVG
ncbi:MAG: NADH-quinone oxidoreductase subunit J [Holosporales bacterium]|jgi:NADH-quinone oxidoreductase subunit J|nr:NADH-quinone oxidoreductase subunit J [Holosporales bacterium]